MKVDPEARDAYDEAVEYLLQCPGESVEAWEDSRHPAARLFQFVTPSGGREKRPDGRECGDIFMIRSAIRQRQHSPPGYWKDWTTAWTDELSHLIGNDRYLPIYHKLQYTCEELEHLADWQRRIDQILGRGGWQVTSGSSGSTSLP